MGAMLRRQIIALLRNYGRADRGNVTMIASFAIIVIVFAIGTAIDFGRLVTTRTALSAAVDAAALQAGSSGLTTKEALEALAKKVMARNYAEDQLGELIDFDLKLKGKTLTLDTTARFPTSFMRLAGIKYIDLPISAEVTKSGNNLEVALVLDTTGSMKGNKLESLKSAAKKFVDAVVWDNQSEFYSKVAVVPYSIGVNLGDLAADARGPVSSGTCNKPGCAKYRFKNAKGANRTLNISSCVSERTGDEAFTDAPPSSAPVGRNYASPNNPCLDSVLMPLNANKDDIKDAIDNLAATGSTAGQIGIAWGWYALSADFGLFTGDSAPAAYGTELLSKIAVIMTDGEFNTGYCNGVIAKDSGNGSGKADDKINCNATNGSATAQAKKLCTEMKKKGITIYTIGFDINDDETAVDVMTSCATDGSHAYLAATDAQLTAAFQAIGAKVTALRLSR